jgi:AraC-like DNA-binding protein
MPGWPGHGEQIANGCDLGDSFVPASRPARIQPAPSATGGIARQVYSRMRKAGIEATPLLTKAGLSIEQIRDRNVRLKVRSQIKFLELAAVALQDDLLGFNLARDVDLREIGLLYYVLASSEILSDALDRAARYSRINNEGVSLKLRSTRDLAITLEYVGVDRRSDRHQIEFWLVTLVRLCRQLTNRRLVPLRIRLAHHREATPAEFKLLFGCAVEFGSKVDEIVFPGIVNLMPIGSADPYLNGILTRYCEEAIVHRRPEPATLRSSVENTIATLLPHGKARLEEIARETGMSRRTLARKLASEGLTFSEISENLKADLARHHLKNSDLPISQIAWLLGYREVGAFTHAYKRWTGMTPSQSRAHRSGESD